MSNPKGFDPANHTQVPNDLFDIHMPDLSGAELKVILTIIRKTRGWHKETDFISYSQIQEVSGLGREAVSRAISGLKNKGLITIDEAKKTHRYEINYSDGFKSQSVRKSNQSENPSVRKSNQTSSKIEPVIGSKIEHTKESIKETNKRKSARERIEKILKGIAPPPALKALFEVDGFRAAYLDYRCYLKEKYNFWPQPTEVVQDYKKLFELMQAGNPPVKVIEQTIQAKNKSFYKLRNFQKNDSDSGAQNLPIYKEL